MDVIGRSLVIVGVVIVILGCLVLLAVLPSSGNLPGDFSLSRPGFKLYFPLATSILLSILLTVVVNIAIRLFNR
jgi:hypothetical protein